MRALLFVLAITGCTDPKLVGRLRATEEKLTQVEKKLAASETELTRVQLLALDCKVALEEQEYLLEAPQIMIGQPASTVLVGAFHGSNALADCQQQAQGVQKRTRLNAWCRRGAR